MFKDWIKDENGLVPSITELGIEGTLKSKARI